VCVYVALGILHATRMRHIVICSLSRSTVFFHILYIKMNVCMFVPYTNPHFWTDRNQTLHTSSPWSGRDRRACMGPLFDFILSRAGAYLWPIDGCRRHTAPPTALYPWCGPRWCDVKHGGLCNENVEKWTWMRVCENGNLMRRDGSD
jgi:hypothetical protein